MFRRKVKSIAELLPEFLRKEGLETPLQQKRLIMSWDSVVGENIAAYCGEKFIKNQTLYVKIENAALRADLTMSRANLVHRLNEQVGAQVIADIRFYLYSVLIYFTNTFMCKSFNYEFQISAAPRNPA